MKDHLWNVVEGHDTDGKNIREDLEKLFGGELDSDEAIELMVDLVREGEPSTAAFVAVKRLVEDFDLLSGELALEVAHTACLILGLSDPDEVRKVDAGLAESFSPDIKNRAVRNLLVAASVVPPSETLILAMAGALLVMGDRSDLYAELINSL